MTWLIFGSLVVVLVLVIVERRER